MMHTRTLSSLRRSQSKEHMEHTFTEYKWYQEIKYQFYILLISMLTDHKLLTPETTELQLWTSLHQQNASPHCLIMEKIILPDVGKNLK